MITIKSTLGKIIFIAAFLLILPSCQIIDYFENDQLAEPKKFEPIKLDNIISIGELSTSWREGKLYYILDIVPSKNDEFTSINFNWWYNNSYIPAPVFTIGLLDSNNFCLLNISDIHPALNKNDAGMATILEVNSSTPCSRNLYKNIRSWQISYK